MEKIYFLQSGSNQVGPFSLDELRYKYIKRSDLVWHSGIPEWTEAQNIAELKVLFPQSPPALPTINLSDAKQLVPQPQYYPVNNKITYFANNTIEIDNGSEIITYRFANFGERLGARLLDVLIIIIPASCLPIIAGWLYFSLQHSGDSQQTIGQKAADIKLLSADGQKIKFGQATGRYFANLLNLFTLFIGYLMFFFSNRNQCLHDSLAGTIVVREINRSLKTN